ncbi:phosphoribosyltransferase [Rathayibacter rathayi]|nr:phosphoribosyltransferase [Rathayibacter rathayi]
MFALALRTNPRRAHLLVSKVLGKHLPQVASAITAASTHLADLVRPHLRSVDRSVVVGYAEAATALGASVANALGTRYLSSTRYPRSDAPRLTGFQEEHSHASAHHLTPASPALLTDSAETIVLVDDELTTGRTIQNTIRQLHAVAAHEHYVVATLVDLRTASDCLALELLAVELGARLTVVASYFGTLTVPDGSTQRAAAHLATLPSRSPEPTGGTRALVRRGTFVSTAEHPRDGLIDWTAITATAEPLARRLAPQLSGQVLVLGTEEDMYLPLRVASSLESQLGRPVHFASTTRSPAAAIDDPGYGIRHRIVFTPEPGDERYLYNVADQFDTIVVVVDSLDDLARLDHGPRSLIDALAHRTGSLLLMAAVPPPRPLHGPDFGSYAVADVTWLLTDLSDVPLELGTVERAASVARGDHYAQALPVEFVPTPDYEELYRQAVSASSALVAEHVAVVAERALAARGDTTILVSLARAGTPIGVLMRRYILRAHGIDATHYAVSIVRGRGIDAEALDHIGRHHDPSSVIFVDGWTGKGAISHELDRALRDYQAAGGPTFSPDLAVLADPGHAAVYSGTHDDYLIPSAALNSTVSGLVSRTVLNDALLGPGDFHGAKVYRDFAAADVSNAFIDVVAAHFDDALTVRARALASVPLPAPTFAGWAAVERIAADYGIGDVNLVKPGVGETTRVLLRRVPWKILTRDDASGLPPHIQLLVEQRHVPVERVARLPFSVVGLIHPSHSPGAVGADGRAAA